MIPPRSRTRSDTRIRAGLALAAGLLALGGWGLAGAPPARAEDPVTLSQQGQITDRVGALGDREAAVARTAIEPALRQNDWAGVAIGAARGYDAVHGGLPVPVPAITPGPADPGGEGDGSGGAGDYVLPVVAVGAAGAFGAYAYRRRKRREAVIGAAGRGTTTGPGWPEGAPDRLPLPELDARAKTLLVETDDSVRTSTEELGFASAQFGDEAVSPFTEAVEYAKGELTQAFRLRQQLDDAHPEDDAARRRMLDEIVARCTEANRRLDARSADFDRLRDLEKNAPQALATVGRSSGS